MSDTMIAAYEGTCDSCMRDIDVGDECGHGPFDELLCEECHYWAWEDLDDELSEEII